MQPGRPAPWRRFHRRRAPVDARVAALLSEMTLEEKVAQMHGSPSAEWPGLSPTAANGRLGIPGLRMVDGPRGVSARAGNATTFPVGAARGATFDVDLERRIGEAIGAEARPAAPTCCSPRR